MTNATNTNSQTQLKPMTYPANSPSYTTTSSTLHTTKHSPLCSLQPAANSPPTHENTMTIHCHPTPLDHPPPSFLFLNPRFCNPNNWLHPLAPRGHGSTSSASPLPCKIALSNLKCHLLCGLSWFHTKIPSLYHPQCMQPKPKWATTTQPTKQLQVKNVRHKTNQHNPKHKKTNKTNKNTPWNNPTHNDSLLHRCTLSTSSHAP